VACTIATNGIGRGGKVQLGVALPRNGASKSAPATAASKETDDTDLEEGSKLVDAGKYGEAIAYFGRSINHNRGSRLRISIAPSARFICRTIGKQRKI
jgi:hypothetical protein